MDRQQFWRLLEPIHPKAEGFCRKLLGNKDDGDDLYQASILTAVRKFGSLKQTDSFNAWIFKIIINQYKNKTRSLWKFRKLKNKIEFTDKFDPRNQLTAQRWLNRAMRTLSADEKSLIVLYEIEGWKINELSSVFKKPGGTIKARLARARKKMRKEIDEILYRQDKFTKTDIPVSESWAEEKT